MPFLHLGADEFKLIYAHSRHWPGFWQTCTATYHWIKETWSMEKDRGTRLSLSRFSDHVFSHKDYFRALAVTPSSLLERRENLLSVDLIRNLVTNADPDTAAPSSGERALYFNVLEGFKSHARAWVATGGFHVPRCTTNDHFWVFVAYEAAVLGRRSAVSMCLAKMRGDGMTAGICLEFLARVYKCHNSGHESTHPRKLFVIPQRVASAIHLFQGDQLAFNDSIYLALQHKDPVMIKYVIKNVQINLLGANDVDRWTIKYFAVKPGMEHCLKVLKDYDFF